jgi:predicted transcriptional regulator
MAKTQVYSWRVASEVKEALEQVSRERGVSMASIIDDAVNEYLARPQGEVDSDDAEQRRLHEAVRPFIGSIRGGDPDRASQARQRVRQAVRERHRQQRANDVD